jgi:hypothetical protein
MLPKSREVSRHMKDNQDQSWEEHTACVCKFILLPLDLILEAFSLPPCGLYPGLHLLSTQCVRHDKKPVLEDYCRRCQGKVRRRWKLPWS